jgi:hypothetical protein
VRRLALLALVVPLLVACGDDQDGYCDAVKDHQEELSEHLGSKDPDALLAALDIFRDLQDRAPSDIADEWQAVVGGIGGLWDALEAAGADPDTYDPANPPPGVTPEEQRAIRAASRRLTSPETLRGLQAVDQQVRDVCHTPLFL